MNECSGRDQKREKGVVANRLPVFNPQIIACVSSTALNLESLRTSRAEF